MARGTRLHAEVEGGGGRLADVEAEVALSTGPSPAEAAAGAGAPTRFQPMSASGGAGAPGPASFTLDYVPAAPAAGGPEADPLPGGRATPPPLAVRYLVRARGTLDGARFERTAGGVYLHRPGGRLLASATRVAREQGDLRLHVELLIERPGTYFVYAELWGGAGGETAIAFARERLPGLPAGRQSLSLLFGGRNLKERDVDGPYVVRNVRLQQVDTHPAHEADPLPALPPTGPYPAKSFY